MPLYSLEIINMKNNNYTTAQQKEIFKFSNLKVGFTIEAVIQRIIAT